MHDLHGEETTLDNLLLVYLSAIIGATTAAYYAIIVDSSIILWKLRILFLLLLDVFGGIVANFSKSTNEFYTGKRELQFTFISLHILHPLLFWLVFGGSFILWCVIALYVLGSAFLLLTIKNSEQKQVVASFVVAIGILLFSLILLNLSFLSWFPYAFMIKIDLEFASRTG